MKKTDENVKFTKPDLEDITLSAEELGTHDLSPGVSVTTGTLNMRMLTGGYDSIWAQRVAASELLKGDIVFTGAETLRAGAGIIGDVHLNNATDLSLIRFNGPDGISYNVTANLKKYKIINFEAQLGNIAWNTINSIVIKDQKKCIINIKESLKLGDVIADDLESEPEGWKNHKINLFPQKILTFLSGATFFSHFVGDQSYTNNNDFVMELVFDGHENTFELQPLIGIVLDIS